MSSDHGHGAADAHHEAFDPEPVQELGADEAPSPGWLPVLGGALLLVGATWFFYPGASTVGPEAPAAPAASAAKIAAPPTRAKPATAPKEGTKAARSPGTKEKLKLSDIKAMAGKPASSR